MLDHARGLAASQTSLRFGRLPLPNRQLGQAGTRPSRAAAELGGAAARRAWPLSSDQCPPGSAMRPQGSALLMVSGREKIWEEDKGR